MTDTSEGTAVPHSPSPAPLRAIATTRNAKISKTVARLVVKDIAERGLEPGSPLATETLMAAQYQVGRSTIREAMRILEAQGLVTMRQGTGGGPLVGNPDGGDFGETMTMFLQVKHIRFAEILEATAELDGLTAGMLARKVAAGTVTDLSPLVHACEAELVTTPSDRHFTDASVDFHNVLRSLGGNYVLDLTNSAVAHIFTERTLAVHFHHWSPDQRAMLTEQHQAICRAIQDGDAPLARDLACGHLMEISAIVTEAYPGLVDEMIEWR